MDLLQTGHSSNERQETSQIGDAILEVLKAEGYEARTCARAHARTSDLFCRAESNSSLCFLPFPPSSPACSSKGLRVTHLYEKLNESLHRGSRTHVSRDRFNEVLTDLAHEGSLRTNHQNMVNLI